MVRAETGREGRSVPGKLALYSGCAGLARRSEKRKHHRLPGAPHGARDGAAMAKNKTAAALVRRAVQLGYPVELRAPLIKNRPRAVGPFDTEKGANEREEERLNAEWSKRLRLLADHYEVALSDMAFRDKSGVLELLFNASSDWVPGLQIMEPPRRSGAPATPEEETFKVYLHIDNLKRNSRLQEIERACAQYRKETGDKRTVRTLANVYRRGKGILQERQAKAALLPVGFTLPRAMPSSGQPPSRTKTRRKSTE